MEGFSEVAQNFLGLQINFCGSHGGKVPELDGRFIEPIHPDFTGPLPHVLRIEPYVVIEGSVRDRRANVAGEERCKKHSQFGKARVIPGKIEVAQDDHILLNRIDVLHHPEDIVQKQRLCPTHSTAGIAGGSNFGIVLIILYRPFSRTANVSPGALRNSITPSNRTKPALE